MRSVMKKADRNMISNVDALPARRLRRRWRDDVKAQIVAESYAPGAVASEVARRYEISPQLPFGLAQGCPPRLAEAAARHRANGDEARRNGRDPGSEFVKRRDFFRFCARRPRPK